MNRITTLVAATFSILSAQEAVKPAPQPFTYPAPALPPVDPNDFKLSSSVELVLLDASVKDEEGGFVSGLTKENFQIFENKQPETMTVFQAGDIPVTLGLVVDNSGSMRDKRPEVVVAALTFVQQSNPQDELFIVNFNDTVRFGLPFETPFTNIHGPLREALLGNPVQGRTALNDGLRAALAHLEKGHQDKKTLVLISDGGDNMSGTTEDEILQLARKSRATIYTIGIYDDNDKDRNPGFLKKLAAITGGEAFLPGDHKGNLVAVGEKIARDIRSRYTLGYIPTNRTMDGVLRKVRVVAKADGRAKLHVRTRTEYVAGDAPIHRSKR